MHVPQGDQPEWRMCVVESLGAGSSAVEQDAWRDPLKKGEEGEGRAGGALIQHLEEAHATQTIAACVVAGATEELRFVVLEAAGGIVVDHEAVATGGHALCDGNLRVVALWPRVITARARHPLQGVRHRSRVASAHAGLCWLGLPVNAWWRSDGRDCCHSERPWPLGTSTTDTRCNSQSSQPAVAVMHSEWTQRGIAAAGDAGCGLRQEGSRESVLAGGLPVHEAMRVAGLCHPESVGDCFAVLCDAGGLLTI